MSWVGTIEAAKQANCSPGTICQLCKQGKIKFITEPIKNGRFVYKVCPWSLLEYTHSHARKSFGTKIRKPNRKPHLSRGYVMIYKPEHHRANHAGYVAEHILVAEEKHGRPIVKGMHVHHINRIRHDNRPENLEVFESQADHMRESHSYERRMYLTGVLTDGHEPEYAIKTPPAK